MAGPSRRCEQFAHLLLGHGEAYQVASARPFSMASGCVLADQAVITQPDGSGGRHRHCQNRGSDVGYHRSKAAFVQMAASRTHLSKPWGVVSLSAWTL